jgi:L-methionine (R)-S-oxide reductase
MKDDVSDSYRASRWRANLLAGFLAGLLCSVGGAVKDSPYEGFKRLVFFRSIVAGTVGGLVSLAFARSFVLAFAFSGYFERFVVEGWKIVRGRMPGKFEQVGMPSDGGKMHWLARRRTGLRSGPIAVRASDPRPADATIGGVVESRLLDEVFWVLEGHGDRRGKAAGVAEAIRRNGGYRWVGLYEVTEDEIVNLAFSGPGAPMYPRFPITQGLSGAAVSAGETVVVGDVAEDPRYLTAFGSTRSEIIVPVVDGRKIVGTIDVESERKHAFSEADLAALEHCAVAVVGLFRV